MHARFTFHTHKAFVLRAVTCTVFTPSNAAFDAAAKLLNLYVRHAETKDPGTTSH